MLSFVSDFPEIFAVCAPGLEPVVAAELARIGLSGRIEPGGVTFRTDFEGLARAHVWLRAATRLLVRVGAFDAPGRRELAARAQRLAWAAFLRPGAAVRMHVSARNSRLYHTGLVTEVIAEACGFAVSKEPDAPEIHVRLLKDRCVVSIDASGELLHRRGYRQESSRAPLRETLAAGMLLAAGYDGDAAFVDPMCGSGTLAIEAALLATHTAPGLARAFAFERFPAFEAAVLARVKDEARARIRPAPQPIEGSDVHSGALAAARRNAERAGVAVKFERIDVEKRTAPAPTGLLATNPPYGERIGEEREAAKKLATALGGPFRGWTRAVLCARRDLQEAVGLRRARSVELDNGGIRVTYVIAPPEVP